MTTNLNDDILIIKAIYKKGCVFLKSNRVIIYVLILIILFSHSACTISNKNTTGATEIVDEFFKSAQVFNLDKMSSLILDNTSISNLTAQNESWFSYFREMIKRMSYEIIEEDIMENKSNVTVKCNFPDGKILIQKVVMEYYTEVYKWIAAGKKPTIEETNLLMDNLMKKHMAENKEPIMIERNVTIECIKSDNGWLIKEMNTSLGNILTANFIDTMYELQASLEEIMANIESLNN